MSALKSLGYFSETSYITIGDPYSGTEGKNASGAVNKLSRYRGKQFSYAPPKKGQYASDAYFTEFKRLYEGERYENPGTTETKSRLESTRAKIGPDWRPSSPPKKSSGKGNYYGSIGPKFAHAAEYDVATGVREKVTTSALPNIRTNPAKKGGFGVPNVTIGKAAEYKSEPYDLARREERDATSQSQKNRLGAPFRSMVYGMRDFDTCKEYKDGGLAPDDPFHKIKTEKFGTPFKPSSPAKSHRVLDTFLPFPEYKEDPISAKLASQRAESTQQKAKMGPIFVPTSGPKSTRTRPIRTPGNF